MKIFLNPGHDRALDSGAVNPSNGAQEAQVVWDITTAIADSIEKRLRDKGIDVKVLQSDSLSEVVWTANNWDADYFVSVHCNAFNTLAHGTEVEAYTFNSTGAELAKSINDEIVNRLGTTDRGVRERPGLYVLKYTNMPSVLIELAFIDNDDDCNLLLNRQSDFAAAVTDGILKYIGYGTSDMATSSNKLELAPNGKPYEDNDIQYLLNQGYTRAAALSFLDMSPKYASNDTKNSIGLAVDWANSRVGSVGYGNNGCTAFVKDFLKKAEHPLGILMETGSQGNLMWVPNLMTWAKANNLWKEADEGGAVGDVCLLETNYCRSDGPDHVVISCGDGNYWGNSSSRNKIVKSNIAYDYGEENVFGYIATGKGAGFEVVGKAQRSAADIVGDAGSTSYVNLAPNGIPYDENDIQYLVQRGYPLEDAIHLLSQDPKYTKPSVATAPNGRPFEKNDIDYLLKNGYSYDAAIALLSNADKYVK